MFKKRGEKSFYVIFFIKNLSNFCYVNFFKEKVFRIVIKLFVVIVTFGFIV